MGGTARRAQTRDRGEAGSLPSHLTVKPAARDALLCKYYSHAPHSYAATVRSEAEILVYLQRERAQGMDEL